MVKQFKKFIKSLSYPSYVVLFVTGVCNAKCKMCFYEQNMQTSGRKDELTIDEYHKISKNMQDITILGISGGEPFIRDDLAEIVKIFYKNNTPLVTDLPTNAYFTDKVLMQVEKILQACPDMILDIQLSIDGPEDVHDEIRGLKNGFKRLKNTYHGIIDLKKKYQNLKVKVCVVYSHYNEEHIEPLFRTLEKDFSEIDRLVFSVAHGTVVDNEVMNFDWQKYFKYCDYLRNNVVIKDLTDIHSMVTVALRMVKNDYLAEVLKTKDVYKHCGAGKKVLAIGEKGEVYPCEPLWKNIANLRDHDYRIDDILNSRAMKEYQENIKDNKCNCHWGLPLSNNIIHKPKYYPKIAVEMARLFYRSLKNKNQ